MTRWDRVRGHLVAFAELYVAVLSSGFAALLTVWQVLGLSSEKVSQALLPWVLTVVCVTLYRDRLTDRRAAWTVASLQRTVEEREASLAQAVEQNTAAIRGLTRNGLFDRQDEPYRQVIDHINTFGADRVLLFQLSGKNSSEVMTAAMRRGATVELFVAREDAVLKIGSQKQKEQISSTRWLELSARRDDYPRATLKVMELDAPISIRAVRVDDAVICVGAYTYEQVDRNDTYRGDRVTISGHDRPTGIVWAGTPEYDIYNEMIDKMLVLYQAKATQVQFHRGS